MATSAAQPPGHLSEVFRFLSSCSPAHTRAYDAFQSPYYTFNGRRPNGIAAPAVATASGAVDLPNGTTTTRTPTASPPRRLPPLTPRALSAASAAAPASSTVAPLPQPASPVLSAHDAHGPSSPSPATPPPPTMPVTNVADAAVAVPILQRTVPSPAVPKRKSQDGVARASFDTASVGSIELPVEQQPDVEFHSPSPRHIAATGSTFSSFRTTAERPKDLTSFTRLALHTVSGAAVESVGSNERSQSGANAAASPSAHHVSFGDVGASGKARSCPVASQVERRSSQLFLNGESLPSFPGARRVSLRRPVFDEDED